ncbi:HAD family hydrolase [Actinokineospora sp.]|uniref:HAD family hydrolase n=1 Tax=Actinokineospora sp. TaxID=1872133 RepID=UPI0040380406
MSRTTTPQVLIFDADDTLWENNVLFERVIEDFLDWLDHPTMDRHQIRGVLDDIETANAVTHGYGSKMLLRSLHDCFTRLRDRPATTTEHARINQLATALIDHQVDLIPGVADTLTDLGDRHALLLLTKGDVEEQRRKLDASQLAHHFRDVHIVTEKDVATYRDIIARHGLRPSTTWMIGNSPKSDIVPARAAGLNAVFIPNDNTWILEHAVFDESDNQVLALRAFTDLLDHF